ncbi:integrase, catalytic region, zinc finger, CCHC-type containing protein [Tanacetum coccineum]
MDSQTFLFGLNVGRVPSFVHRGGMVWFRSTCCVPIGVWLSKRDGCAAWRLLVVASSILGLLLAVIDNAGLGALGGGVYSGCSVGVVVVKVLWIGGTGNGSGVFFKTLSKTKSRLFEKLGFTSCKRNSGATKGINVLIEKGKPDGTWAYGVSCMEYTEFDKFGIAYGSHSFNSVILDWLGVSKATEMTVSVSKVAEMQKLLQGNPLLLSQYYDIKGFSDTLQISECIVISTFSWIMLTSGLTSSIFLEKSAQMESGNTVLVTAAAENEDLKAQIQDKVFVITSMKNDLRKIKRKEIVDIASQIPSANTSVPRMFKLDLEPLAPRLLQNREAHIYYLKDTQKQADILREIVEKAKAEHPLDKELDFSCKHAQQTQELLVYVRDTCPNAITLSAKKVAVTPKNKVKKVRFDEPFTSSSNSKQVESSKTLDSNTPVLTSTGLKCSTSKCESKPTGNTRNDRVSQTLSRNMKNKVEAQPRKVNKKNCVVKPVHDVNVKHSLLHANSEPVCATCKKSLFDGVHDICFLDFMKNVNNCAKSAKKHKKENIWRPTGHVFTEVGLKWKPTGRTFTIVGNMCPLTRITSANVVPPKTTTSHSVESQKPELKVYSRKLKNVKNVASSKKAKIVESKNANHSEPNHTWGSNATDIPSSSSSVMTVRFGNDHIARIMGYGDYQLGNVTISRVYYVEGLGHNLFSVGQFCDGDLEVAFRKNTCFIRNLEGVDLLSGSRDTNLYTISLDDMLKTSPICLLSKASKTKSWLWHRRLSHLNFGTINKLAKDGLARGIPRLKFQKDHLCSACALGKSKKSSHQPKAEDTNQEKLYLLHMDLCGPMRVASINGKRYILVIVDDYSRFTWVRFLRTKDEAPEAIIKCIKNIQVRLNAT